MQWQVVDAYAEAVSAAEEGTLTVLHARRHTHKCVMLEMENGKPF